MGAVNSETCADTKRTLGAAAHFSDVTALLLSPSHSLLMPLAVQVPLIWSYSKSKLRPQSALPAKLPARE